MQNLRPYNAHKLSFWSRQCVFLGYSGIHKGYKSLDPSIGQICVSRDVIFDKLVFPFANSHTPSFPSRPKRISESILLPSLSFPSNLPPHDPTSLLTHTYFAINDQLESREHTTDLPIDANLDLGGDASVLEEHMGIKHLLGVSLDFNKAPAN